MRLGVWGGALGGWDIRRILCKQKQIYTLRLRPCRRPRLVAVWLLGWLLGLANWLLVSWWFACWLICWLAAVLLAGWLVGWVVAGWLVGQYF